MKQHHLTLRSVRYPGGLRIIECESCSYALAVEVDQSGIIRMETAVSLDHGDYSVSHAFFQAVDEMPTLGFDANVS